MYTAYLKALQFENTRYEKITNEHKGSLEWLWAHEQYRQWSGSERSHLFYIQGKPGSGKSTIMKYVKDHLLEHEPNAKTAIMASFFYSYREGESQISHYNMLRSILYEILNQNESFFYHFQHEFRKHQTPLHETRHDSLSNPEVPYNALKDVLRSIGKHDGREQIYLLIDAVDESTDEDRRSVLQLLFDLCSNNNRCIIKAIVAGRPVVELEALIRKSQASIRMQDVNHSDIKKFVRAFLGSELQLTEGALRQATQEYILENAQGVFLWVHLVRGQLVKFVEKGCSKSEIFGFLKSLPTELEDFYKHILKDLEKNEESDVAVGKRMFELVLFASRPLRVPEFQHALAIADYVNSRLYPTDESFQDYLIIDIEKRIIHCSGNLLEIKGRDGIFPFKNSDCDCLSKGYIDPVVQVMHQTVREFLLRPKGPRSLADFGVIEDYIKVHARIVTACICYLIFFATLARTRISESPRIEAWTSERFEEYVKHLHDMPLLNYALNHLQDHLQRCRGAANKEDLLSQLVKHLTVSNPSSYLLTEWITSYRNITPGNGLGKGAKKSQYWVLLFAVSIRLL
jgi:hypothetical protein